MGLVTVIGSADMFNITVTGAYTASGGVSLRPTCTFLWLMAKLYIDQTNIVSEYTVVWRMLFTVWRMCKFGIHTVGL